MVRYGIPSAQIPPAHSMQPGTDSQPAIPVRARQHPRLPDPNQPGSRRNLQGRGHHVGDAGHASAFLRSPQTHPRPPRVPSPNRTRSQFRNSLARQELSVAVLPDAVLLADCSGLRSAVRSGHCPALDWLDDALRAEALQLHLPKPFQARLTLQGLRVRGNRLHKGTRRVPGLRPQMRTACREVPVLRGRYKWSPRVCTRFRVRSRFPRADRLLELQAASHAACWKYKSLLPSYLSVRLRLAAGNWGKAGWKESRAEGWGISGRDDLRPAVRLATVWQASQMGGKPRRISCAKSSKYLEVQLSKCREFVASRCGAVKAMGGELH